MARHYVAFWNVENLFDVEDAPLERRPDKVRRAIRADSDSSEVRGWSKAVLKRKLERLASVISRMDGGRGPDLLGVCEVENRHVLERLAAQLAPLGRRYAVVHADTEDRRGVDVAFLYDTDVFRVDPAEVFSHFVVKRTATRDLLQASFFDRRGRRLVCIGNHWPSRLGGQYESEPFRIIAAESLAYFHERIAEIHGHDVAVLAMGDFNDEPFDRSMVQHARSERTATKVQRAGLPSLLNLMWGLAGDGQGSHFHENRPGLLDQLLVSKGLIDGDSGFRVDERATEIVRFDDTTTSGLYPQPRRFARPSRAHDFDPDGVSDHYPVATVLHSA